MVDSLWVGEQDWPAVRILQNACHPTGHEAEGAEGPNKMLCSPEDVDEAARDQSEATS